MGVSVHGTVHPHLHSPCPVCGYARRFKQFGPIPCACSPDCPPISPRAREHDQELMRADKQRVAEHERSQEELQ